MKYKIVINIRTREGVPCLEPIVTLSKDSFGQRLHHDWIGNEDNSYEPQISMRKLHRMAFVTKKGSHNQRAAYYALSIYSEVMNIDPQNEISNNVNFKT